MEKFAVGSVVLVTFSFSNLKGKKIRPALVLAQVEFDNLILCQITSKPYASKSAIRIESTDFEEGNLPIISYIRPDKLFTAETSIIEKSAGKLTEKSINIALQSVRTLFTLK
jgi:mRNA-degrading endonuclease toxin of MazEF toxin-antitoxin module